MTESRLHNDSSPPSHGAPGTDFSTQTGNLKEEHAERLERLWSIV